MNKAGRGEGFPRSQTRDLGHPAFLFIPAVTGCASQDAPHEQGWLRVEVSHPSDKNKSVARMGHPAFLFIPAVTGCASHDAPHEQTTHAAIGISLKPSVLACFRI